MAALASPRQPPPSVQQLTPPSSSHGGRGSWDFAVPLTSAKPLYVDQEPFMSEDVPSAQPYAPRQPLASQPNGHPNGYSKPSRTNTLESQPQYYDDDQGRHVANLHKKPSGDVSAIGSDPNSVLEHYNSTNGVNGTAGPKSASQPSSLKGKKKHKGPKWTDAERDENNWIHRDKLKEIESRELEEFGFKVGRASRSNSRSHSASRASRNRTNSGSTDRAHNGELDPRRLVSPAPAEEVLEVDEEQDHQNWDLRTSEEIAAERERIAQRNIPVARPGTSRIPIAKISPVPVPHTVVDRDAPLPRSRTNSASWSGDLASMGARVRSGSVSSQVMLDDPEFAVQDDQRSPQQTSFSNRTSPTFNTSPQKAKTPGKSNPTSGARKASQPKLQPKQRNASSTSPIKRPGTGGGSLSRPGTSHRPEGEAPWIASMYKPDPRLPPDQQIIPTHAKRMRQEQWENEGKTGSLYDKDFRLLNTDQFKDKRASQISPIDIEKAQEDGTWPLPSPTKGERSDMVAKSPTNEQGAYKLTPTIPQSPRVPSPRPREPSPKPAKTTRLPEPPAEQEKEKGCCGCTSDGEDNQSTVSAAAEVEVSADASAGKGMSVLEALKGVLKLALIHDGLARGLREASKALDRRQAHMCVLNEACEEEAYKKLVVALCSEHKIPLIKVPDGKQLGEWAGLCQIDREGNPRKVVNCSCVVVKDWGEDSQERSILLNYFQTEQ
ncbi:hypothetical protein BS50DRAFT_491676 [Corynespora cassiicola Philippines]|uniref:40S ribosomal protein S12 n=1 Tax=Corynespora cassiicola Philippines TaxID=1448308 RepID=A0A2T2NRF0_CORCC|nr:hypothetical protein BS50DRAFT_491676 [Corynespora cassiicola Philippines]